MKVRGIMQNIKTATEMIEKYESLDWLTKDQIESFTDSLVIHIRYVQEAGRKLGIPEDNLEVHDWSKWTDKEFPYYARKFFPGQHPIEPERIEDDFARAWLNHIHCL